MFEKYISCCLTRINADAIICDNGTCARVHFKLFSDMGDIADDINEVFSLQSSVYKAIGELRRSCTSNPAG